MLMVLVCCTQEPPAQQIANKQPVEFDQAINYVNKIKVRSSRSRTAINVPWCTCVLALGGLEVPTACNISIYSISEAMDATLLSNRGSELVQLQAAHIAWHVNHIV